MGQTVSGPLGFASFLSNVSRDVCPLESYPPSAYRALCPLDLFYLSLAPHPPSAGFLWLLALASCLWAKASQISNLEIPPPASAWYAQLPSKLFTAFRTKQRCHIELNVSKRNSHPLFTPLPKATFLPNLSTALPVSFVSLFQPWSYITNRCLSFGPKPVADKSQGFFCCSKIQLIPFSQPPLRRGTECSLQCQS